RAAGGSNACAGTSSQPDDEPARPHRSHAHGDAGRRLRLEEQVVDADDDGVERAAGADLRSVGPPRRRLVPSPAEPGSPGRRELRQLTGALLYPDAEPAGAR